MQNLPKVIGVTGRKFNGKDTVGKFLAHHGYIRIAFADALKDACRCIFGFSEEQLYGGSKEVIDEFWQTSPRRVLQFMGTDLCRDHLAEIMPWLGNNVWVEVVKKKILDEWKTNPDAKFVITDVRFPNEIDLVKSLDGISIRVVRNEVNTSTDPHPSEIQIDTLDVNHEVSNNESIESLYINVENIFSTNNNVTSISL
jgi:hypothetical protein